MNIISEMGFRIHIGGDYRHAESYGATASSPIGLLLTTADVDRVRENGPIPVTIRATYCVELELDFVREDGAERLCLVAPGFRIRPDQASIASIISSFGI